MGDVTAELIARLQHWEDSPSCRCTQCIRGFDTRFAIDAVNELRKRAEAAEARVEELESRDGICESCGRRFRHAH